MQLALMAQPPSCCVLNSAHNVHESGKQSMSSVEVVGVGVGVGGKGGGGGVVVEGGWRGVGGRGGAGKEKECACV